MVIQRNLANKNLATHRVSGFAMVGDVPWDTGKGCTAWLPFYMVLPDNHGLTEVLLNTTALQTTREVKASCQPKQTGTDVSFKMSGSI